MNSSNSTGELVAFLVAWGLVGGVIGTIIGGFKGRATAGFWLGFFLGPIGWIVAAVIEPSQERLEKRAVEQARVLASVMGTDDVNLRPCQFCAELIQPAAILCRYCGRDVPMPGSPNLWSLGDPGSDA